MVVVACSAGSGWAQFSPFGQGASKPSQGSEVVEAALLSDYRTVEPGQTLTLALRFEMRPGWHIYWHNPGDSGMPPRVEWTLPTGWTVSEPRWPIPKRFMQPGDIVGYGYGGETMLLFEVTVGEQASMGEPSISAAVTYLVCDDQRCLPGDATVSRSVKVGDARSESQDARTIDAWQEKLPSEARLAEFARSVERRVIDAGRIGFTIDWKKPVSDVRAYPFAVKRLEIREVMVKTGKGGSDVTIHWQALAGSEPAADALSVLITWVDEKGDRHGAVVEAPLAGE